MGAKAANQRIDREQLGVAEESHPQFKIVAVAARIIHATTRSLPQTAAPIGGFLLDVAVGASQKGHARPAAQLQNLSSHAFVAESCRPARDPLDFGKSLKHAAYDE